MVRYKEHLIKFLQLTYLQVTLAGIRSDKLIKEIQIDKKRDD